MGRTPLTLSVSGPPSRSCTGAAPLVRVLCVVPRGGQDGFCLFIRSAVVTMQRTRAGVLVAGRLAMSLLARHGQATGALSCRPSRDDSSREDVVDACGGVDFVVVGAELVDLVVLEVGTSFAWSPIATGTFATVELVTVAVHRDEEDVEAAEEVLELEAQLGTR